MLNCSCYTVPMMFDYLLPFDLSVARAADRLRTLCGSFLTPVFKGITLCGNFGLIFIFSAIVMLFFRKTRKSGTAALIALSFGALFTNIVLKHAVARDRPFADPSSEFYLFWKAAGCLTEKGYSFPSGHTTAASAFSFTLFYQYNKRYSWAFLAIPLLMGFTRVYFSVHFASDVLGGIIVGFAAATIAYFIVRAISKTLRKRNNACKKAEPR